MSISKILTKSAQLILIVLIFVSMTQSAPGEVAPSFNAAGAYRLSFTLNDLTTRPGGKIIGVGGFTVASETSSTSRVTRFVGYSDAQRFCFLNILNYYFI